MKPHNPNLGKSPFDPDYRDDYNQEEDLERYEDEQELKEQLRRENR